MFGTKWIEITDPKGVSGYAFGMPYELPWHMATALIGSGRAKAIPDPGLPADVKAANAKLAKPAPAPEPEPVADTPEDDPFDEDELVAVVVDALADGRKPALVDALEVIGLDPDDYTNNEKRADALRAWLEE